MDLATLTAAQQSLKALVTLAKGAASAVVDHQVRDKLIEVQQGILDVQAQLANAVEERLNLLHENSDLKEAVRTLERAKLALEGYELVAVDETGKFLYRSKASAGHAVEHFACPTCFAGGKVSVLQSGKTGSRQVHHICTVCKSFNMYVGPSDPRPTRAVIGTSPWSG